VHSRFRKFVGYYRPYRGVLLADLLCAFVVAGVTLVLPLCVNYITKTILVGDLSGASQRILLVGAGMLALIALHTVCNWFIDYRGHLMGAMMERDMRNELFAHYQSMPFEFYDERQTGQLMTLISNDSFNISELYHHGPEDLLIALLKLIGVVSLLLWISVPLTLMVLAFVPFMLVFSVLVNRWMYRTLRQSWERIGDINAQLEDSLAGIRTVKSFANEPIEQAKFVRLNERFVESRGEGNRSEAYFYCGMTAFMQLILCTVVVFGGMGIVQAQLDLADLLTFILLLNILDDPVQRFVNFARLYQEGMSSFNRFMDMLELQPSIRDAEQAQDLQVSQGRVELERVTFAYQPGLPPILRDFSLTVEAHEYLALVGASGVGKSTICSLIPRFYDLAQGAIRIDGQDIRTVTQDSLHRQIGVVQQDVFLFAGTVAENIAYGRPGASRADLIAAAKQANAHEFIMRLPQGYDTPIGQRGVRLSGGQKQRLSIARVFLKNPPILIFDEATSALDNESERAIQDSLEVLRRNRTTIVIAHRLSTIHQAERIVVLDEHGICEQGTHAQLMAQQGQYAFLHDLQLAV
jgi:ATP-binding cassette subfamily B protein